MNANHSKDVRAAGVLFRELRALDLTLHTLGQHTVRGQLKGDPVPWSANWCVKSDPKSGHSFVVMRSGAERRFPITKTALDAASTFQNLTLEKARMNPFTRPATADPFAKSAGTTLPWQRNTAPGAPGNRSASVPPLELVKGDNTGHFSHFLKPPAQPGALPGQGSASAPAPRPAARPLAL